MSLWMLESGTAGLLDRDRQRAGSHVALAAQAFGNHEGLRDGWRRARVSAPERLRPEVAKRLGVEARDILRRRAASSAVLEELEVAPVVHDFFVARGRWPSKKCLKGWTQMTPERVGAVRDSHSRA